MNLLVLGPLELCLFCVHKHQIGMLTPHTMSRTSLLFVAGSGMNLFWTCNVILVQPMHSWSWDWSYQPTLGSIEERQSHVHRHVAGKGNIAWWIHLTATECETNTASIRRRPVGSSQTTPVGNFASQWDSDWQIELNTIEKHTRQLTPQKVSQRTYNQKHDELNCIHEYSSNTNAEVSWYRPPQEYAASLCLLYSLSCSYTNSISTAVHEYVQIRKLSRRFSFCCVHDPDVLKKKSARKRGERLEILWSHTHNHGPMEQVFKPANCFARTGMIIDSKPWVRWCTNSDTSNLTN